MGQVHNSTKPPENDTSDLRLTLNCLRQRIIKQCYCLQINWYNLLQDVHAICMVYIS